MVNTSFLIAYSIYWVFHTNAEGFKLRKTNAADEWLVGRLYNGRKVLGGEGQTYCTTHSNSLSNKMDNSLLVVRYINHKYIEVEKAR